MIYSHEFSTPRNIYEKLIRDYEMLDTVVNGDNLFNFVSTAYHMQGWIKNSPLKSSESMNRFVRRLSNNPYLKICKKIITAKVAYKVVIDDPKLKEGDVPDFSKLPLIPDKNFYESGKKKFKLIVDGEEFDPFIFKEKILDVYSVFFKVK